MKVTEMTCKSALSPSGIYGWVYALNPYRGCMHGCKYCYASNILRLNRSTWGSFVEVKKNIPTVLAKELKRLSPALVGISSITDPYQSIEENFKTTRYCLEQLLKYKFPVSIITKSPLVLRDIDLLINFPYSEITLTITTLDDKLAEALEPAAPTVKQRLKALTKLSAEGLNTYAFLGPLLPNLDTDMVSEFIDQIIATGVRTVMVDSLNLKSGVWSDVKRALDEMPEIKDKFYNRLFRDKEYYPTIFKSIKTECLRRGVRFE